MMAKSRGKSAGSKAGASSSESPTLALPITRVVLFSSGVGYYEHSGEVEGDQATQLTFDVDQINDALKSLVVLDQDGGTVGSVTYPSQEPVEHSLRSFEIDLSMNPTLADLLGQLRGSEVRLIGAEETSGLILGVETIDRVHSDPKATTREPVLNLSTAKGLRAVPLRSVDRIELADAGLQRELSLALELLAGARNTKRRPLEISFTGKGRRRVRVGYLIESAIWKTSYRLDLSEDKPWLQAWAIVDNTSNHDWRDVELSLVSGQPISFVQDLYTPLIVERPTVANQLGPRVQPQIYEEDIVMAGPGGSADDDGSRAARSKRPKGKRFLAKSSPEALFNKDITEDYMMAPDEAERSMGLAGTDTARSLMEGEGVGELFQFTMKQRVSIDRKSSAMLPLYNGSVEGEKLSIYNRSVQATRPLNGVSITNSTGAQLLAGPITVYEDGIYAGDAQVTHMTPDDERLISYAVDLKCTIDSEETSDAETEVTRLVQGVLHVTKHRTTRRTYTIRNKRKTGHRVLVEHRRRPNATIEADIEPIGTTRDWHRFRIPVGAEKTVAFVVTEREAVGHTVALLHAPLSDVEHYGRYTRGKGEADTALIRLIEHRQKVTRLNQELNEAQNQLDKISKDQRRLNENLETAGGESSLGKRYLAKLGKQEDEIEALQVKIATIEKTVASEKKLFEDYLAGLDLKL